MAYYTVTTSLLLLELLCINYMTIYIKFKEIGLVVLCAMHSQNLFIFFTHFYRRTPDFLKFFCLRMSVCVSVHPQGYINSQWRDMV